MENQQELFVRLADYLTYLEAFKGRSPGTVKEYRYDLVMFFRFLVACPSGQDCSDETLKATSIQLIDDLWLKQVQLSDCYRFLNYLTKTRKGSAANRARKVASIKGFFSYLKQKAGLLDLDPTQELESPKRPKRLPVYLNLEEAKQLLRVTQQSEKTYSLRDHCILTLFLNCGLRLSELCSINVTDIRGEQLTVIGKGNKERTIYLNNACLRAIDQYLPERPKPKDAKNQALFVSRQGNRLSKPAVQQLIKTYIQMSGLDPKRYSTHKLRHTAATLMHKYGHVDIRLLQIILGHESVATTEIYTHVDVDDLHTAVEQNPLSNL